jgi:hypothetical protein
MAGSLVRMPHLSRAESNGVLRERSESKDRGGPNEKS